MAIRRIGQIFVDLGFISDEQLEMLLEEQQQRPGTLLGRIGLELNMLNEEQIMQALAEQMGMQVVEVGESTIPSEVIDKMTDIIILTIIGAVLAWAMLPPAIRPDVQARLDRYCRRQRTTLPTH